MINNNHMTMRSLTMVNLVLAKGSRNQCTTSLTPKLRSKHKTKYITVGIRDVRPAKIVF